jgi:uncharacterized membrane protein YfcA
MLFPISGVETAPWIPPLVAFVISFFTSMGGVSGAFLLLPFQISVLGFTSPAVSATNQLYNIVAIPSGVARYVREGRMVWPLTWAVVVGTLPGVLVGAVIRVTWLPDPRPFKLFAGAVLLYIGGRLLHDLLGGGRSSAADAERRCQQPGASAQLARQGHATTPKVISRPGVSGRIVFEFDGELFSVSRIGVFALSLVVGAIGGIYGIGGGAIIAPFFISFFGLPVYTVAGAALMGTFVTSVAGVAFYQLIAPLHPELTVAPDWLLGLLFGVGGMAGMYLGARCQKHVPATAIKWMLAATILFVAGRYVAGFFV